MLHADGVHQSITFFFLAMNRSRYLGLPTLVLHSMLLLHMLFTQQAGPEALVTHGAFERLDVDNHVAVQAAVGRE